MISVKKAEIRTMNKVMVIINELGVPRSRLPVRLASQQYHHRTGNRRKIVYPALASKTHKAVRPEDALTRATVSANKIHPITSFPIPAARVTKPTSVSRSSDRKSVV